MTKRANPPALSRALVQDNVPALVAERLWIGSIHAAFNQDSMQERGITHVLNASGLPATFPRQFTYFTVDIRDKECSNILTAIGAVNIFIEAGIEKGGVLVHCAGGRSRSAAFVVAFIMSTQLCSFDAAYAQVRRARSVAAVNRGFEQQLRAYGAAQCDVFVAHQMMLRVRAAALLDRRNLLLLRRSSCGAPSEVSGAGGGGRSTGAQMKNPPGAIGAPGATAAAGLVSTTGIPPTPRSPRGRGRSPTGGNPATSYWQRRGSGGANVGSNVAIGAMAAGIVMCKGREDQTHFLPKEPRPTRFRLCRPGSASVQVIPLLTNLERLYACRGCGAFLLTGAHIIKLNIDMPNLQAVVARSSPRGAPEQLSPDVGARPGSLVPWSTAATITNFTAASHGRQSASCGSSCNSKSSSKDPAILCGRGERRSPSPLAERIDQPRTTTIEIPVSVSSGPPTMRRSTGIRRLPPPLRVITTELGSDRPPVHSRWVPEGAGASTAAGTAGAATPTATASAAAGSPSLPGASGTVGAARGGAAEGKWLHSPLEVKSSPGRLKQCAAARGSDSPASGAGSGWTADSRRNSTVFVFESEDDFSTVDPSEREGMQAETSSVAVDAFHGGGGERSVDTGCGGGGVTGYSGWEGPAGGGTGIGAGGERLRRGRWKTGAGTPPNAAGELSLMMSSRMPSSAGSGMESVSPLMTPRSPRTPASCGSTSPCASDGSFSTSLSRPQSAEKRQFLMRMNQADSRTPAITEPSSCRDTDRHTERLNSRPAGRWLYVEHLDWMGDIMAAPIGRICCPSTGCGVELGNWTWDKPEAVACKSPTGPPFIRLDKARIKTTSCTRSSLSRDSTPRSSPKSASTPSPSATSIPAVSHPEGANTPSDSDLIRRSSGILEKRLAGLSASPQHPWHSKQENLRTSPPG